MINIHQNFTLYIMNPTDNAPCSKPEYVNIIVNEQSNSIYFNGGVTTNSMSQLTEKLLQMEQKILKKQRVMKRKFEQIKLEKPDKSDRSDKTTKSSDYDELEDLFEFEIKPKPIKLYITSNGGLVYQVFTAIDTIRGLKVPVHTICRGMVASAGTLLSLAGKKRFITENSYMLIHELRAGSWGKFTELSESFENHRQLMEHLKSYYLTKIKMTAEELDAQLVKDVCWNAQTCLEKGLVDEIIKYE
jgi:ATP-dependent Clp endopeptidase proteolytic subunit ClpP